MISPEPVAVVGLSPLLVAALATAAVSVIGAIAGAAVKIIREVRNVTKPTVEKLGRIETLVDGRYSDVLNELASVKRLLANQTGDRSDGARATLAEGAASDQRQRLVEAGPTVKGVA